ncbi:MAG: hypothetical protein IT184_00350 [Acidobacteria bacterium]|nr:hypothetical protein [Acidobacteriota bacterium]
MSRFQPALLGGLFIGVLSSLPIVGWANTCCCLWVVSGGALTAYLLQQATPAPIQAADAALQGLLAGALGAILYLAVFSLIVSTDAGVEFEERLRSALESNPQVPIEVRDRVLGIFAGGSFLFLLSLVTIPAYAVASMIGSLLGMLVVRKKTPPSLPA